MTDERNKSSELLSAYLDGELKDAEAARMELHLKKDPALAAELEKLRSSAFMLMPVFGRDDQKSCPEMIPRGCFVGNFRWDYLFFVPIRMSQPP